MNGFIPDESAVQDDLDAKTGVEVATLRAERPRPRVGESWVRE